jgi:hypothetical protein
MIVIGFGFPSTTDTPNVAVSFGDGASCDVTGSTPT